MSASPDAPRHRVTVPDGHRRVPSKENERPKVWLTTRAQLRLALAGQCHDAVRPPKGWAEQRMRKQG
ncbi:hypothetical protein I553_10504 [Mycobacterium xenopi 4042]|uniref:Uncharacterized protein n=1 Tax=Mycobacterium xenopi 4042 TaxID=1299334 RepID=X8DIB1_MYCXE|nr:hypothetical protein I552_3587 [Mycobacterium xenopi 3993]EUA68357.1 hypothetical protein I553_10504 [Mycobacterium xenopi 4042]